MGQWSTRKERIEKILRQIIHDRDYCLIQHITCIDASYYTRRPASNETYTTRDPHPLFDSTFYRAAYLPKSYTKHPFCHFMTQGYKQGNKPSAFFDYDVYAAKTGWNKEQGNPLRHYLKDHRHCLASPGIFFDRDWYCDHTPTLLDEGINALIRYRLYGTREKKSPIPVFDPRFYLCQLTPEQREQAARDPLSHYAAFGIKSNLRPCEWFDPLYYTEKYSADLTDYSPLEHYLRKGVFKGCYTDRRIEALEKKPRISIVVPVYNAEPHYLNNCIRSVLYQSYPHWELCLADDGSSRQETLNQLEYWKQLGDDRIKITFNDTNKGISSATNSAAELAKGDYIGFLDNDDELTPDCLYHTAKRIADTGAEIIYTDEDLIADDCRRLSIFFKPDFNHSLLLTHNYITHFVAVSRGLFEKSGGLNSAYDGAQDFDFLLRITDLTEKIEHIPLVLYHWRAAKTSVSSNNDQKPYAHNAGKKALQSYLSNNNIDSSVHDTELNFFYRISRKLHSEKPLVTVLVWSGSDNRHNHSDIIARIGQSAGYDNLELILVTPDMDTPDLKCHYQGYPDVLLFSAGKNKAESLDAAISTSAGEFIVLLDSSAEDFQNQWLHELVSIALAEQVNIVCGRADFRDEPTSFQIFPDISNSDPGYYYKFLQTSSLYLNGLHCPQDATLPTADICLISRELYSRTAGFDHASFPELFTLADFALQAAEMDQRVLYTPHARVLYPTRPTSKTARHALAQEKELFQSKWRNKLREIDKYYNPGILHDKGIDYNRFTCWKTGE